MSEVDYKRRVSGHRDHPIPSPRSQQTPSVSQTRTKISFSVESLIAKDETKTRKEDEVAGDRKDPSVRFSRKRISPRSSQCEDEEEARCLLGQSSGKCDGRQRSPGSPVPVLPDDNSGRDACDASRSSLLTTTHNSTKGGGTLGPPSLLFQTPRLSGTILQRPIQPSRAGHLGLGQKAIYGNVVEEKEGSMDKSGPQGMAARCGDSPLHGVCPNSFTSSIPCWPSLARPTVHAGKLVCPSLWLCLPFSMIICLPVNTRVLQADILSVTEVTSITDIALHNMSSSL